MGRIGAWLSVAASACVGLLGCSGAEPAGARESDAAPAAIPSEGPWNQGIALEGEEQELGDPARGRELLLNGGYMGCGIPARLLDNPLLGGAVGMALGPATEGAELEGRNDDNASMPYSMNVFTSSDGVKVANVSCLMCHAGSFNGELIVGLGTADADFTGGFGGGGGAVGTPGQGLDPSLTALLGLNAAETANLNKMMTRSAAFSDITAMRTVGQNPAEAMAIALMAHRNEDLSWSDEPVVAWEFRNHEGEVIEPVPFPSDPPPWWRAKKKTALFYNGMARGDHSGSMALATSICVDTVEQAQQIGEMFKDMHAYVLTLEAPRYPFDIDAELAKQGQRLFVESCAGCHGTYGETDDDDTFPNLLFPLDVIGTDPVIAEGGVVYAPQMVESYNRTYYGQTTPFICDDPAVGYVAPPLDGVWATGPFFHNGSVPTIEQVLNTKARPKYWKRKDLDSKSFDTDALGFPFVALDHGQDAASSDEQKWIYDTTKFGQKNTGHPFGDHLSDDQRRAVLEYLKTL